MLSGHPAKNGLVGIRCFQEASAPGEQQKAAMQGCLGESSCVDCLSFYDLPPKCDFCLAYLRGGKSVICKWRDKVQKSQLSWGFEI